MCTLCLVTLYFVATHDAAYDEDNEESWSAKEERALLMAMLKMAAAEGEEMAGDGYFDFSYAEEEWVQEVKRA